VEQGAKKVVKTAAEQEAEDGQAAEDLDTEAKDSANVMGQDLNDDLDKPEEKAKTVDDFKDEEAKLKEKLKGVMK
jgi:hypothetical protein